MIRHAKTEPAAPPRLLFALARSGFFWKLQRFPLRLSFQISPHAAPATKSDTWTSPNAAPATKRTHELHQMLHLPQKVTHELYQMLHLPRKMNLMIDPHHIWNVISNARPIRPWSEHDPRMIRHFNTEPAAPPRLLFALARSGFFWKLQRFPLRLSFQISPHAAPDAKSDTWTSPNGAPDTKRTHELHQMLHLPQKVTQELYQMLHLPRKMNLMIDPHHIWNVIYNAGGNSQHPPTSPNTAPATQNDHPTSDRNLLKTAEVAFPMRDRSDHDPTQKTQKLNPPRRQGYFSHSLGADSIENYNASRSGYHSKAPAIIPNFTTCCACHEKWHMNFTKCCACHKKWHMNFSKCCACHEKWHMNFTKCCACHEKWHEVTHDDYYY